MHLKEEKNKLGNNIRNEFPILSTSINDKQLVYFDNAATTHKPITVIEKITEYYKKYNSNIERGFHNLGLKAFEECEKSRRVVANFINADTNEIVFTSGTTEGLNILASSLGKDIIHEDDVILLSILEHHSNIIPWQVLAKEKNATIKYVGLDESLKLNIEELDNLLKLKPKIVSITHCSNTLGAFIDLDDIIKKVHQYGGLVIIDAAQSIAHRKIDVKKLDCDFLVFSSHKIYGPTGVGILYGKKKLLDQMKPHNCGGGMIEDVSFFNHTYRKSPYKFEAGTPNIASIIAFKEAINFINTLGIDNIAKYETQLINFMQQKLSEISEVVKYGNYGDGRAPIISFNISKLHHMDIGLLLNSKGIALRTGNHCTQPLMDYLGLEGTIRASLSIYNTFEEIEVFIETIKNIIIKQKK